MKISWVLPVFGMISTVTQHVTGTSNSTKKRASEDYYQINYDYEIFNNNSLDVEFSSDSLILPIPEDSIVKDSSENSEKTDEMVDGDLKEHDFIDNLMYIYYGSGKTDLDKHPTFNITIPAIILNIVGYSMTILFALVFQKITPKDQRELFFHLMFSFCVTNIALLFGVHRTEYSLACLMIALLLTYSRLMTSTWIFLYCLYIFKVHCKKEQVKLKYFLVCGYGLPLMFSLVSFSLAPQSYETQKFCFMSVQRGMIINYMVPIFCLMILTALYCIRGIRIFSMELHTLEANSNLDTLILYNTQKEVIMDQKSSNVDAFHLRVSNSCLRRLCAMQTMCDIEGFFLVLALENGSDSLMSFMYIMTSMLLSFFVFYSAALFFLKMNYPKMKEITAGAEPKRCDAVENIDLSTATSECKQGSSDSVPLLIESTQLKILHRNPNISTISN